ncbi:MAG: sarcosine oxidase subunit gamma family protein [Parvibaculaceae bacterium]|nr:sarcosine oxidase subunit gamma family protein [Parvibaculaceae bacterium]
MTEFLGTELSGTEFSGANLANARTGALDRFAGAASALVVTPGDPATRFIFRGGKAAQAAMGDAFGIALPVQSCRAATGQSRAALWLGPDEWLLTGEDGQAETLFAALESALAGVPHSLVDISHRNISILLSGPKAAAALNTACPLDLALESFPVGMCTRTVFGKAEVLIWRTGDTLFHLETWRSFGPYIWGLLSLAQREYGAL